MALHTVSAISVSPVGGVPCAIATSSMNGLSDTFETDSPSSSVEERVDRVYKRKREETEEVDIELESELHHAVEAGDARRITTLLARDVNIDTIDLQGLTPLQKAVKAGNPSLIKLLLDAGADENIKTIKKETLWHLALRNAEESPSSIKLLEIMQILLDAGIDFDDRDYMGYTPLHVAASRGLNEAADFLLSHKAIIDPEASKTHATPLHLAAEMGHLYIVNLLLSNGADVKNRDYMKRTPLHYAAEEGHSAIVEILATPANINDRDKFERTPLMIAVSKNKAESTSSLIRLGANILLEDNLGQSPLHTAVLSGFEGIAISLIDAGADLDCIDDEGDTPLHHALKDRSVSLIKLLLRKGCDANIANGRGDTPLHIAAKTNDPDLCRLLVDCGAKLNRLNDHDETPLMTAVKHGITSNVQLFIDHFRSKAAVDYIDLGGYTAYSYAAAYGYTDIATIIGSDPFSESFLACKALSQVSGIEGEVNIAGKIIELMGFHPGYFCSDAVHFDMPDDLKEAFLVAADPRKNLELIERIRSGKLAILSTGTLEHSIFIVLLGNRMILCNRGLGGDDHASMATFKIDPSKFTLEQLVEIRNMEQKNDEHSEHYFYGVLPSLLSGTPCSKKEQEENRLIERISPKSQKYENCTAASFKTAVRAALALKELKDKGTLAKSDVLEVKKKSKAFSGQMRAFYEKKYTETMTLHSALSLTDMYAMLLESGLKRMRRLGQKEFIPIPIDILFAEKIKKTIQEHGSQIANVKAIFDEDENYISYPMSESENIESFVKYIKVRDSKEKAPLSIEMLKEAIYLAFAEKMKTIPHALSRIVMIRLHEMSGSPATDDLEKWAAENILTDPVISFAAADEVLNFLAAE